MAQSKFNDTYAAVVFGECGAGKSTSLNNLMGFYCQHFGVAYNPELMTFEAKKSPASVTKCCTTKTVGGQTLVDTPGTDDPDKNLTDVQIQAMTFNELLPIVSENQAGITTFVQCIQTERIRESAIQAMCRTLLSLTFFYEDADVANYPTLAVFCNGTSRHPVPKQAGFGFGDKEAFDAVPPAVFIEEYRSKLVEAQFDEFNGMISKAAI